MKKKVAFLVLLLCATAFVSQFGCTIFDNESEEANIIITNQMANTVDVYIDGIYQFTLAPLGGTGIIPSLDWEEYLLEARDTFDGAIIASTLINIQANIDYQWLISPIFV